MFGKVEIAVPKMSDEVRAIMEAMREFGVTQIKVRDVEIVMPPQKESLLVQPDPRVEQLYNEVSLLKTAVQFKFNTGIK